MPPLLEVDNLRVRFDTDRGVVNAVNGISFALEPGETLGLVGESGSGKSVTSLAVLGLLPVPPAVVEADAIRFEGRDLLAMSDKEFRTLRGNRIAMIFQDPMTSLNPFLRVSRQLTEVLEIHMGLSGNDALNAAIEMLERVGIPSAASRVHAYPHEFSGGMRQREYRARDGHVWRSPDGRGVDRAPLRPAHAPVHPGSAPQRPAPRRGRRSDAVLDSRPPAAHQRCAAGVSVRPALRAHPGGLRATGPARPLGRQPHRSLCAGGARCLRC